MKSFILGMCIFILLGIGFLQLKFLKPNNPISLRPAEAYFQTPQYGHEGEGIDVYKNAMAKELKKMKATRSFGNLWQHEGPFDIGGRINCIAIHPTQINTYLIGCADGGIFKTTDGGSNWTPIFDNSIALSVSAIEYDKSNPMIVYAGTGDQVAGGYSHMGNGIYKSTDGGTTWSQIGLGNVGAISKLIIDPNNSNTIYVSALGNVFLSDTNRGIYKSTDGGVTWSNILYLGLNAGIADMVINPTNSNILYATGRRRFRSNTQSIISGPEAKIYKTIDGGMTWDTLINGLPNGAQSRIGLAISSSNPNLLYAVYVDSANLDFGGLYKSTNGGTNWNLVNTNTNISMGGFGWYFGQIRIDPTNNQTIYILSVNLYKSIDGGLNFSPEFSTHADKHDLKFLNSNQLLLATDGGFYKSTNAGNSWTQFNNLPITQFYEVGYNPHDTSNYYGGAQDNGTSYGSMNQGQNNWSQYYGGDGFRPQFSSQDELTFYAEWQNGNIVSTFDGGANWNTINTTLDVTRTSWNTPYFLSKYSDLTLYAGTYRVYKNTSAPMDAWTPISPDLTNGTPNNFHVITTIDQSSLAQQTLYAGTSDGRVWVTTDDGGTWLPRYASLPNRNVSCVLASPNNANHVFVSQSGYRNNDSLPHIYYSEDRGATWNSIAGDLPSLAINDIWVLPSKQDSCLVVATDGGVYATENKGLNWNRVGTNMPLIPVYDLDFNPKTKRLIAGTFARSMQTIEIDSIFKPIQNTNVGIENIEQLSSIKIYPNPCTDFLYLVASHQTIESITIFDYQGRKMKSISNWDKTNPISLENIPPGFYIISVRTKEGHLNKPFTKK